MVRFSKVADGAVFSIFLKKEGINFHHQVKLPMKPLASWTSIQRFCSVVTSY